MTNTTDTLHTHLAVRTGPNGLISVALDCDDTDEACAFVRENGSYWGNQNALGITAAANEETINAALEAQGWRVRAVFYEKRGWSVHCRA